MVAKNGADINIFDYYFIFHFNLQPGTSAEVAVSLIAPGLGVKK